ncbi:MAG: uncharacterized protein KVP18_002655 [Porospora cf. gigantea A]|uniref:uncharacterized protein n=1 Tax=Porospora cf. gigantea A TaxID=2853593 RepID=UPI003559C725|nr:MAG: hypothetical protein KVP18_002655 [Porospora cf. gigantea A]
MSDPEPHSSSHGTILKPASFASPRTTIRDAVANQPTPAVCKRRVPVKKVAVKVRSEPGDLTRPFSFEDLFDSPEVKGDRGPINRKIVLRAASSLEASAHPVGVLTAPKPQTIPSSVVAAPTRMTGLVPSATPTRVTPSAPSSVTSQAASPRDPIKPPPARGVTRKSVDDEVIRQTPKTPGRRST